MPAEAAGEPRAGTVRRAVRVLASGGLLVHPTATVYGIGAADPAADREIARLKGREPGRPLLRIASDLSTLVRSHPEVVLDERAERLAAVFWPGPLTLVLEDGTPEGRAVRVEGHPVTARILRAWGGTMSSTSLNPTGGAPAHDRAGVRLVLERMPESSLPVLWVDAGDLPGGPPSTLLNLRVRPAELLREGAVSRERLESVAGPIVDRGGPDG